MVISDPIEASIAPSLAKMPDHQPVLVWLKDRKGCNEAFVRHTADDTFIVTRGGKRVEVEEIRKWSPVA